MYSLVESLKFEDLVKCLELEGLVENSEFQGMIKIIIQNVTLIVQILDLSFKKKEILLTRPT